MKRAAKLAMIIMAVLLAVPGCFRRRPGEQDRVLAVVGRKEIRESDFRAEVEQLDPNLRSKYRKGRIAAFDKTFEKKVMEARRELLDRMIEEELLHQQALGENIAETPEARRRIARAAEDAAIERLKKLEVYARITVSEEAVEARYRREVSRPEGSGLVSSFFYVCELPGDRAAGLINGIENDVRKGLSFEEIARQRSLACQALELGSAAFQASDLPTSIRNMANTMRNRTGVPLGLGGVSYYFFRDPEPLFGRVIRDERGERAARTSCFYRIRQALRNEKRDLRLREWVSSLRDSSTIRRQEEALDDLSKTDAVAAEVNGVSVTVGDVAAPLEGLSFREKEKRTADKKALLDEAIDRELLRQKALEKNLFDDEEVKDKVAAATRPILIEVLTEKHVVGHTVAAREQSRSRWIESLKKAAEIKILAENLEKMYIPPSKDIQDIFGSESI